MLITKRALLRKHRRVRFICCHIRLQTCRNRLKIADGSALHDFKRDINFIADHFIGNFRKQRFKCHAADFFLILTDMRGNGRIHRFVFVEYDQRIIFGNGFSQFVERLDNQLRDGEFRRDQSGDFCGTEQELLNGVDILAEGGFVVGGVRAHDRIENISLVQRNIQKNVRGGESVDPVLDGGSILLGTGKESDVAVAFVHQVPHSRLSSVEIVGAYARNGESLKITVDQDDGVFVEVQLNERFVVEFLMDRLNDDTFHAKRHQVIDGFGFLLRRIHGILENDVVAVLGRAALHRSENAQAEAVSDVAKNQPDRVLLRFGRNIFDISAASGRAGNISVFLRSCIALRIVMRET